MFIWDLGPPASLVFPGRLVSRTVYRGPIVPETMWPSKFDNYLLIGSKSVGSLLRVKFLLANLMPGLKDPPCFA